MKYLSFTIGGELYAADVTLVMKMARDLEVTPVSATPSAVMGLANLNGRIVTVLSFDTILSGRREEAESGKRVNAVIFKPFTPGGDLMALSIDKPGDLADISEENIHSPPAAAGAETGVLSVAEAGGKFYRIIDVKSIVNKFSEGVSDNENA